MKHKCLKILLLFLLGNATYLNAQQQGDTTFSFYFHTAQYQTDSLQQKAFQTFLQSIGTVKTIRGYTDTVGSPAYNSKLAHRRAEHVFQLLPPLFQTDKRIKAEGETNAFSLLWQNRRVDVVAAKPAMVQHFPVYRKGTVKEELNVDNILFLPDQPVLTEASFAYVKALAQQLQQYPTETFQIIGHVNYQSNLPAEKLKDLYALSEARAKAVYNLLVQNGIAAERMTYKGVGNSNPVYPEPLNDDQKRKNMRVQVLILRN